MHTAKKFLSVLLVAVMVICSIPQLGMLAKADEWTNENYNEYMFIADTWSNRSGTDEVPNKVANNLIKYFTYETISPCGAFVNGLLEDESIIYSIAAWESANLAAKPSSAFKEILKAEDYCLIVIFEALNMTFGSDSINKVLKSNTVKYSEDIINDICKVTGARKEQILSEAFDLSVPSTKEMVYGWFNKTTFGKISKIQGIADDILKHSENILDLLDALGNYLAIKDVDQYIKNCIEHMHEICPLSIPAMKAALQKVTLSWNDFSDFLQLACEEFLQTGTEMVFSALVEDALETYITKAHPLVAAVFAGLDLGVLVSNVLFATEDEIEQIYTMEKVAQFESLVKTCLQDMEKEYLKNPNESNAQNYIAAVQLFFNTIAEVNCENTKKLMETVFNAGLINWVRNDFGKYDAAEDAAEVLDALKNGRKEALHLLDLTWRLKLKNDYPEIYEAYGYGVIEDDFIPIEKIQFRNIMLENTIAVGEKLFLNVVYTPADTSQKGYFITSSDESVIKVTECVALALSPGEATITVQSTANPSLTHSLTLTVVSDGENPDNNETLDSNVVYTEYADHYEITKLNNNPATVKLASIINGKKVTKIANEAFHWCTSLTSVTIPDSVTSIGDWAFSSCTSLTSVTIPDSVTSIGDHAFRSTSLTSITIPDSVTSIGRYAFCNCPSLTSVTIPDSVTSIGDYAFKDCTSLTSVTIGDSVTSIGEYAFRDCTSLTDITVDADNTAYCSEDGVLFNKSKTELIQYPVGNARTSYTIPDSVTSIGGDAFEDCTSLTSVTIPDSVTSIGHGAFEVCTSLTSVTIPDSVMSIGKWAFSSCTSLTSVTIPDSVTSIGDDAFSCCRSLTSVTIGDSVTSIGAGAFEVCTSLTSVIIGDSVTSIGYSAFRSTSLTSVTIPDSVTSIGEYAFSGCTKLTSVTILNPDCEISDSKYTIYSGAIIYGFANSTAQRYAEKYNRSFEIFVCSHENAEIIPAVAATCTTTGLTEGKKCSVCGEILEEQAEVSALGHTEEIIPAVAATCTTTGLTEGKKCSVCGEILEEQAEIPALGHNYVGVITTAPTCTQAGVKTYTCQNDARHSYTEELDMLDHVLGEPVMGNEVAASCETDGYYEQVYYCTLCNKKIATGQMRIPATGHTEGEEVMVWQKTPTCEQAGGFHAATFCTVCGKELRSLHGDSEPLGHEFSIEKEVITATCTKDGYVVKQCVRCDKTETTAIPALGHTEEIIPAVAPTCTEMGLTEGKKCSVCGEILEEQAELPALGHTWDAGVVTTAPTVDAEGVKTFTCLVCGETKTEPVDKLVPSFTDGETIILTNENIVSVAGATAAQLLSQAGDGAAVADKNGNALAADAKIGTGAVLTLADGTQHVVVVQGDADGDGAITSSDARSLLRYSVGLDAADAAQKLAADVDSDGRVSSSDARLALRASVGLEKPADWLTKIK